MNILFLTTHANTGGISSYIMTLGAGLVKSGHQVWVVSGGGDCEDRIESLGMRHIKLNIRTKSEVHPKLWLSLPALKDLVSREGIDIIHAQTRVTQVLGAVLSRLTGVNMVTTCHGFFKPRWFRRTFPCWGRAVIAISKPVALHLQRDFNVPADRIHLIANGIDVKRFAVKKIDANASPVIGIIARLSDVKGIDVLIKAMPRVLQQVPQARLVIAGRGPEETGLRKLVQDLSLQGKVEFKDTVNQTQDVLIGFDVFVMPSLMEGLGLSVMGAQAAGVPVVASGVGGLIDLIEDGKSGYLVPVKDHEALAGRIIDVLADPVHARFMAQQARFNIERHFSAERMLEQTIKCYEQYSRR